MKKVLLFIICAVVLIPACSNQYDPVIRTKVPVREAGQTDVIQLRTGYQCERNRNGIFR